MKLLFAVVSVFFLLSILSIFYFQPVKCYFSNLILFSRFSFYYPSCLVPCVHEKYISFMHVDSPEGSILVDTRKARNMDGLFSEYSDSKNYEFVRKISLAINHTSRQAIYFKEKGDRDVTMLVERKDEPFTWGYLGPEENLEHFKELMGRFRVYPGE